MKRSCGHTFLSRILFLLLTLLSGTLLLAQVTVDPCIQGTPVRIVILGSSTAAGSGPSSPDSTWVNRYRKTLQSINPNNQVINLAVGGFTTYRVMPDGFVPNLTGRPLPDTTKNISEALRRDPDAIIVNLPSNDRQWPMEEQLQNFDSIYKLAASHGVPMWICTTQPLGSASFSTYQRSVHDSILQQYGSQSIEFFLPLADSNDVLLSQYNSGDNVHLNNAGHRVLWNQVVQKDILASIISGGSSPDLAVSGFILPNGNCLSDSFLVGVEIFNLGSPIPPGNIGTLLADVSGLNHLTILQISDSLFSCSADTIWRTFSFNQGGLLELNVGLSLVGDTIFSNDSLLWRGPARMRPSLVSNGRSICDPMDTGFFRVMALDADTVFWYQNPVDVNPVAYGDSLGGVLVDSTLYAQAVSGDLSFHGKVSTPIDFNISWNGIMIDLMAADTLFLDSLSFISANSGSIPIRVFATNTSHRNVLATPSAWNMILQDTLLASIADQRLVFELPTLKMDSGDTLGLYIELLGGKLLRYRSINSEEIYSDGPLSLMTGTGVSNNFGGTYHPRRFNGEVFFHHGFNPMGECASQRMRVHIGKGQARTDIDTVASTVFMPIIYSHPDSLAAYLYVIASTGDTLSRSRSFGFHPALTLSQYNEIWVFTRDSLGCEDIDTLWLFVDFQSLAEMDISTLIYPNPAGEWVRLAFEPSGTWEIIDLYGRIIQRGEKKKGTTDIDISAIPEGCYLIHFHEPGRSQVTRLMIRRL
ncbi:MAG: SGNH/GDSL hydrolase family protein [Bacteroidota bacterium]|nr:SGNH/GDSL hydrolase family protein [Bacteroidota bacterium]